ncbi:trypsin 5G1-like [Plodia interpunctella]|uniref:trypsin 5G1-like n=1 Tax=Plodia interpunctella TaxID=58824 RepID=UPI002367C4BE|nr:trypsin 5G1-like [Plodia interpunctella]
MQLTCKYFLFIAFFTSVSSLPIHESESQSSRIVNGYAVDITEVPYQAALRGRVTGGWSHICGAVIIGTRAILTAGHCTINYTTNPSLLNVVVGTSSRLSGGRSYDVSKVIVHENYSESTLENDISMLVTVSTISFSESVSAIQFAPSGFVLMDNAPAIVSGFGTTSYEGASSSILLAAQVNIVSQRSCARAYLRIGTITSGMICAGGSDPPRDACQGDSGGPLVANNHLVGIVSWGEGCADNIYPGVYTRVSEYAPWIEEKLYSI